MLVRCLEHLLRNLLSLALDVTWRSRTALTATLTSAMKGYGGGALGVSKEKKIRAKLLESLKAFLGSAAPPAPV